jgi:L-cysteine:1D-myo-inositol 2-amino-2-deoxy-alpha-D-glucopyranoside ligase
MVGYQGEKMSKSKGNLVLVSKLRADGVDPMAIRIALLAHGHDAAWEWYDAELQPAIERLSRWRAAFSRPSGPTTVALIARLRDALRTGLDSAGAMDAVDDWAAAEGSDESAPAQAARAVDALLGVI